jgi:hypothetical protein
MKLEHAYERLNVISKCINFGPASNDLGDNEHLNPS